MKPIAASLALAILSGGVALADIPVDDDQQLTQKTLTQTTTTSTVPVQQNNNKGQGGINCATHQGQKGTTQNNTAQPNTATGNTAVQQYDPQSATAPANPTTAPGVATQNLDQTAASVVAGNAATQTTITANGPTYQTASTGIGPAPTFMAGYDQNSSLGTQNGLSWNQVLQTANLLVTAYNAINVSRNAQLSQAARAMAFVPWAIGAGAVPSNAVCAAGYSGAGTATSPCVAANGACQSLSNGGCWQYRTFDSLGMSSSISSPRNRRLNRRRTKRGRVMSKRIFGLWSPGLIWSSYALAQVPVIDAANLTQAQQTAANTKQILATDQSHPVECAKDLAGGDRQPLLVGSRLAGANGARRRLFHGPGAVSGFGDFGRAALLRRTRGKFAKHHFDADQRASTRQKPHGTGDGPPGRYSLHELGQHDARRSSASSTRHREP